ncbi:hypothetical protein HOP50_09g55110 [Chloropicon primus]|uniref:Uncharacterized protein n=1 Tax=Chloropicon primus TaxID=1764295 RepID=A0A5B8MQI6_9CHLO|nr:hypothetical protein A3770_09p54860 [Chloropicon primus]UPR02185.1 hypothetical protein HOP50_09g55110 [Chloropicon primus]|eukprot:QDZ22968.1 hypothetical protein A3770_09p54860 [Chloropicon primus]
MSKREGKGLTKSLKSLGRKGESAQENRTYVEKLMRRIVEHVAYREAVRSEPKIIECLELYQQDLWEGEHNKREAMLLEKKSVTSSSARGHGSNRAEASKKKRIGGNGLNSTTTTAAATRGGAPASKLLQRNGRQASKERKERTRERKKVDAPGGDGANGITGGSGHSTGVYNFGALMKEAKTLQEFETTGKKPKKSKKERKRPESVDGSGLFRERSASVAQVDTSFSAKKAWSKARRLSLPTQASRTDYRAARYNNKHDTNGNPLQPEYPFQNPNIFSLAGCGSNQLLQRVLYLACQQNETIKFEKKARKERERTSQMPVLASSVHIQLLCSKETEKEKAATEKSWNSYF